MENRIENYEVVAENLDEDRFLAAWQKLLSGKKAEITNRAKNKAKKASMVVLIISALFCPALSHAEWTINGVKAGSLKQNFLKNAGWIVAGAITSALVHTAGHIAAYEIAGARYDLQGLHETYYGDFDNNTVQWFSRAGFFSQLLVGTVLNQTGLKGSMFLIGYHAQSAIEIFTYPIAWHGEGDLHEIGSHGGDSTIEFEIYTLWASVNLIDIETKGGDK
jgi:hypothetical protein